MCVESTLTFDHVPPAATTAAWQPACYPAEKPHGVYLLLLLFLNAQNASFRLQKTPFQTDKPIKTHDFELSLKLGRFSEFDYTKFIQVL